MAPPPFCSLVRSTKHLRPQSPIILEPLKLQINPKLFQPVLETNHPPGVMVSSSESLLDGGAPSAIRRDFESRWQERRRNRAAISLQRWNARLAAKQRAQGKVEAQRQRRRFEDDNATRIQKWQRQKLAEREIMRRRIWLQKENTSAVLIQSAVRRNIGRNRHRFHTQEVLSKSATSGLREQELAQQRQEASVRVRKCGQTYVSKRGLTLHLEEEVIIIS